MPFPKVDRNHIIPNSYLRNFAPTGVIGFHMVGDGTSGVTRTDKVGVRKGFYKRHREDGTRIDDIEAPMARLERLAAPIHRGIEQRWPLPYDGKGLLAAFVGLQHVRGPRWVAWHDEQLDQRFAELREATPTDLGVSTTSEKVELIEDVEEHLRSDTQRFFRMFSQVPKAAAVFGSMHWSLVKFDRPILATSDHPIVAWPIDCCASPPALSPLDLGCLRTLEVRFPLSPRLALLMTWIDAEDTLRPIRGSIDHARNLNAFTIAQADRQWFHDPQVAPPLGSGRFRPLSGSYFPEYDSASARASARRQVTSERVNQRLGSELDTEFEITTVRRAA